MKNEQLAAQAELAASILRTNHPFEWKTEHSDWTPCVNEGDACPIVCVARKCEIRLALATPGDGRVCHNPDNLTAEQVGAGWRLLLEQEFQNKLHHSVVEFWNEESKKWKNRPCPQFDYTGCSKQTYRLPLSTPWPEAKVEPWKLPEPPAGKKWHRNDWTKAMLPDGYRPLVMHEEAQDEDEFCTATEKFWRVREGVSARDRTGIVWIRTKRPLPVMVPLEAKDVLPGSVFRHKNWKAKVAYVVANVWTECISYASSNAHNSVDWEDLRNDWEINKSIPITGKWDADAWEACEKEG